MIGGNVTHVNPTYNHIEVIVRDGEDELAIKVKVTKPSQQIAKGDSIWWQGSKAYWTPKQSNGRLRGNATDIQLFRIGYSYKPTKAS